MITSGANRGATMARYLVDGKKLILDRFDRIASAMASSRDQHGGPTRDVSSVDHMPVDDVTWNVFAMMRSPRS